MRIITNEFRLVPFYFSCIEGIQKPRSFEPLATFKLKDNKKRHKNRCVSKLCQIKWRASLFGHDTIIIRGFHRTTETVSELLGVSQTFTSFPVIVLHTWILPWSEPSSTSKEKESILSKWFQWVLKEDTTWKNKLIIWAQTWIEKVSSFIRKWSELMNLEPEMKRKNVKWHIWWNNNKFIVLFDENFSLPECTLSSAENVPFFQWKRQEEKWHFHWLKRGYTSLLDQKQDYSTVWENDRLEMY
jgi:hypothetical protein